MCLPESELNSISGIDGQYKYKPDLKFKYTGKVPSGTLIEKIYGDIT